MPKILFNLLFCVLLTECRDSTSNKIEVLDGDKGKDTAVSFSVIRKDSSHIGTYRFDKKILSNGLVAFNYIGKEDTFSVFCDTSSKRYKGQFGQEDIVELEIEKSQYYTINGIDFKVLKLIAEKNTDGAFSLFISPEFGLLLNKSNTWRAAKVVCPDKSNPDYLQITTLLYRIQTDNDFFSNPIPDIKKFTTPKVE